MAGVTINIGYADGLNGGGATYSYNMDGATIHVMDSVDPDGLRGYRKCVHTTQGGAKIGTIKTKWKVQDGFQEDLGKHSVATVYLWTLDKDYEKPLVVHLGDSYYITSNAQKWSIEAGINPYTIQDLLDGQSCKLNKVQIADISRMGITGSYECPTHKQGTSIILERGSSGQESSKYTVWVHRARNMFGNIRNGGLTIHSPPVDVKSITVYISTVAKFPLLFYYRVGGMDKWFGRYRGDEEWVPLENETLADRENSGKIERVLEKRVIPRVTIDVSTSQSPYSPNGNSLQFSMQEIRLDSSDYYKFIHSRVPPGDFTLKNVVHGRHKLLDMQSHGSLDGVSAFYYGNDPTFENSLLLIELESQGKTVYTYFERQTSGTGLWTEWTQRGSQRGKLSGAELKNKLGIIKDKLKEYPEAATPPSMPENGPSPNHHHSPTSEHSHHSSEDHSSNAHSAMASGADNSTSAPPDGTGSTAGTVGAIVGSIIGAALLGILGWKLTPVVKNYVARRHSSL